MSELSTVNTAITDIRGALVRVRADIDTAEILDQADQADMIGVLMALHHIREVREVLDEIGEDLDSIQADMIRRARRDPVPAPWQLIADNLGVSRQSVTKWWTSRQSQDH